MASSPRNRSGKPEGRLMAQLPEGTLMRRAAFGLARHARRMLGRTAGRRVGAARRRGRQRRRRALGRCRAAPPGRGRRPRCCSTRRARTRPGSPRFRRAGGRVYGPDAAGLAALTGADLVLDGIVGISGRGGLRDPAPALVAAVGAGRGAGARRRPAQRRRHRHRRGRRRGGHGHRDGHVRRPQARARARRAPCGPVHVVDIGLGPYLPTPHARPHRRRRGGAVAAARADATTSTARAWRGWRAGSDAYPGAAVLATGAAVLATSGMVRFAGSRRRRRCWPAGPRWSPRRPSRRQAAPRPGRSGRASAPTTRPRGAAPPSRQGRADRGRRRRHHPAGRPRRAARGDPRPRRGAHPARRGVRPDRGRGRAPTGSPPPAAPPPSWASPCCSRATPPSWPTRTDGRSCNPTGGPWAATAGSGDVLTGISARCSPPGWSRGGRPGARRSCTARAADLAGRRRPATSRVPPQLAQSRVAASAAPRRPTGARCARRRMRGCGGCTVPAPRRASISPPSGTTSTLLRAAAPGAALMAVVKADGYGHGAVPVARAALQAGATWLGVCTIEEALELRAAGLDRPAPVLAARPRRRLRGRGRRRHRPLRGLPRAPRRVIGAARAERAGPPGCTSRSTPG